MRILVVSPYYAAHGGGSESAVRQLLLAFREVAPEYRFSWAATDCDTAAELPGVINLPMAGGSRNAEFFGGAPLWSWTALRELASAVKAHDAVWLQDTLAPGAIAAEWLAHRASRPVIITQHAGLLPQARAWRRRLTELAQHQLALPMLRRAWRSVFTAAQVKAEFAEAPGLWASPPLLVPNGVMHSVYKTVGAERRAMLREKYALADKFTVLFVGRGTNATAQLLLRELARQLPEITFLFTGRDMVAPVNWGLPHCQTVPERTGAARAELYQAADLLVLPSYGEGLPLVVQEAAACGLPVLCAPDTAAADPLLTPLLNTAPLNPFDPTSNAPFWQEQLLALRGNALLRHEQSEALSAFAREHWSWQQAARAYAALFAALPQPVVVPAAEDAA